MSVSAYAANTTLPAASLAPPLPTATTAQRAKIDATARQFESQFLGSMLGQMFEGTEASAPFGGGAGESAFKSFLTDAFAKTITKHGGIGLAKNVSKEMLKLQGLS